LTENAFRLSSTTRLVLSKKISVFTDTDDKPLREILKIIREKTEGGKAPDPKSDNQKLKDFFETIMPDYDRERVYVSHMKKIYAWYNLLQEKDMLEFTEKPEKRRNHRRRREST
jgi:hypothetical protein